MSVRFDSDHEFQFMLHDNEVAAHPVALDWLDGQFVELGAEPLRASGKVPYTCPERALRGCAASPGPQSGSPAGQRGQQDGV